MPIVIKGPKLTPELQKELKDIFDGMPDLFSRNLAARVREVDGGVEIPCGYRKLYELVKEKFAGKSDSVELTELDQDAVRTVCKERNQRIFTKFIEYNKDYIETDNNALLQIISSPGGIGDIEKISKFLKAAVSKITPTEAHKFKVYVGFHALKETRDKVEANEFMNGKGESIKDACNILPLRFQAPREGQRRLPMGIRLITVIPAREVKKQFEVLSADGLFDRVPFIRFVNLVTRTERRKELQAAAADGKSKHQKHKEGKQLAKTSGKPKGGSGSRKDSRSQGGKAITVQLSGERGRRNNRPRRDNKPRAPRLPCFVTIGGIPEPLTFATLKDNLDPTEHAHILKAIAESRQKRYREPISSEVAFFCTEANGKIIEESFGTMTVNDATISAKLVYLDNK